MLIRTDSLRDLDRLTQSVFGTGPRAMAMPMDAYRKDDTFVVHLDLPGVSADAIDVTVERNVLTVRAERRPVEDDEVERIVDERSYGTATRQLVLGDTLDTDRLAADYTHGVLTLTLPVAEKAKPRRVEVTGVGPAPQELTS